MAGCPAPKSPARTKRHTPQCRLGDDTSLLTPSRHAIHPSRAAPGLLPHSCPEHHKAVRFTDDITVNASSGSARGSLFVDPDADYLRDHFPGAPMLPGLLMLEAAVRTAAELLRARQTWAVSESVLERLERLHVVRRVVPGETFIVQTTMIGDVGADRTALFSAIGDVAGQMAMRARFRLRALSRAHRRIAAELRGGTP